MNKPNKVISWYGWLPDRPDQRDLYYTAIAAPPKKMPSSVDLRAGCSTVENQGQLGSCTANALAGSLEFLEKRIGKPATDLSRLFIYYNERALEGNVSQDSGAMIRDGIKTLAKQGVCEESRWPYVTTKFSVKPPAACYQQGLRHQITTYHRIVTLQEMRMCLAEGYPFVFGITVYEGFESPAVSQVGPAQPAQAVRKKPGRSRRMAAGTDEARSRILIRNSWGRGSGCMKGHCNIRTYAYLDNRDVEHDSGASARKQEDA